jgi:hypothetical protein
MSPDETQFVDQLRRCLDRNGGMLERVEKIETRLYLVGRHVYGRPYGIYVTIGPGLWAIADKGSPLNPFDVAWRMLGKPLGAKHRRVAPPS